MELNNKYKCPCCGYYTYNIPAKNDCGYICPVCFWENDTFLSSIDEPSDANHGITLLEAQRNFKEFGACEKEMVIHVRKPKEDEMPNRNASVRLKQIRESERKSHVEMYSNAQLFKEVEDKNDRQQESKRDINILRG